MATLPKARLVKIEIDELAAVDEGAQAAQGTVILKRKSKLAKATWTTAHIDDLPDSSFLFVEDGGKKDAAGKTTPRSLRHFPYRDENGAIDIDHLRDAISRIPQSSLPATLRNKLQVRAEKLLGKQHMNKRAILADLKKRGVLTALQKRGMLTTAESGHAHLLDDGDGAASGCTDGAYMSGAIGMNGMDSGYHWHPWARSSDGTIMIGEAAGHSHVLLTPDELQQILDADDADVEEGDDVVIAKSTPSNESRNTGLVSKENTVMADHEIAELKKRSARLEKLATLTDAQRAYHGKLVGDEAETFLAKSAHDRDAEIAKAIESDPVEVEFDGVQYRKSAGAQTIALAKRSKAQAELLAKRDAEVEAVALEKRARTDLGATDADVGLKSRLLKAVDREFADAKDRDAVIKMLKGDAAAMRELGKARGFEPGEDAQGDGPDAAYEQALATFAKAKNKTPDQATEDFLATDEGERLWVAQSEARFARH